MKKECDAIHCIRKAKFQPIVLLYPPGKNPGIKPMEIPINISVCIEHKKSTTPNDLTDGKFWNTVDKICKDQNKILPDRDNAKILWVRNGAIDWNKMETARIK